jgi:AcrR family transcriptional regulator
MTTPEPLSRGERTQQVIRDAAYTLFVEQGYAATSMRQIAQRAETSLGGIYNHYASKEAIFQDIFVAHHPFQRLIPIVLDTPGDDVQSFIENAARRMVDSLKDDPDFLNLVLIEFIEFDGRHSPLFFEDIYRLVQQVSQRMESYQDQIRPIPIPMVLRTFWSLFFAYFITELFLAGAFPDEMRAHSFENFVDIFLHGILKPDA